MSPGDRNETPLNNAPRGFALPAALPQAGPCAAANEQPQPLQAPVVACGGAPRLAAHRGTACALPLSFPTSKLRLGTKGEYA